MKTKTHHTQDTMLSNVGVDTVFKEKIKQWRKSNWKIKPESKVNLERSIRRFENKFGGLPDIRNLASHNKNQ